MKKLFIVLLLLAAPALAQRSVPEIPFESVPDFFKYPVTMYLGEMVGVALNSKGHIFMLSHSNLSGAAFNPLGSQLLEFDEKGNYLREIGKGVYGASAGHSLRIDREDNIWLIDKGSNLSMKFNAAGRLKMVLGHRDDITEPHDYLKYSETFSPTFTPPPAVENVFNQPTDIAWDPQDNMYITDGYINSRVAKIDKNGDWIKSWGTRGSGPGQFLTPHNIAIDKQGNLYVADRSNARIQVFDTDGKFLRIIKIDVPVPPGVRFVWGDTPPTPPKSGTFAPGAPCAICITSGATPYLYVADIFPGRIYKMTLDGKILGMLGRAGKQLGQFGVPHEMACPSENELYVADAQNWRVQKLILHPEKMAH